MKKIVVCLLCCLLLFNLVSAQGEDTVKESSYQRAVEFMEQGQYDIAISIFEMLENYKDSSVMIAICKNSKLQIYYDSALSMFNDGEYDAAREVFLMLGDFSDSAQQVVRCDNMKRQIRYDAAMSLADEGLYELALEEFALLGDFADSADQAKLMEGLITERDFNAAFLLEQNGDYDGAIEGYRALEGRRDCAERIAVCEHQLYVNGLIERIEIALYTTHFDASYCYSLIAEAEENNFPAENIDNWLTLANKFQIRSDFPGSDFSESLKDTNGNLVLRVVFQSDGLLTLVRCGKEGVTVLDTSESKYNNYELKTDTVKRDYVLAYGEDTADLYIIGEKLMFVGTLTDIDNLTDIIPTSTGLDFSYTYSLIPLRTRTLSYIIMDAEHYTVADTDIIVDFDHYPVPSETVDTIPIYLDALKYQIEDEMKYLLADGTNDASLRGWLKSHPEPDCVDIYAWVEAEQCFVALVRDGNDAISVALKQSGDTTWKIMGEYKFR